jgi:cyclopropane-fatty-acyl-phospholipid synthase
MNLVPQSLHYYAGSLRQYAGSLTWGPLVQLSKAAILSTLMKIEVGQLKIIEPDGHVTICGQLGESVKDGPQTELRIHKETFWVRMLLFADMVSSTSSS